MFKTVPSMAFTDLLLYAYAKAKSIQASICSFGSFFSNKRLGILKY